MKKMIKMFMPFWITLGVILVAFFLCTTVRGLSAKEYDRENDVCTEEDRVFDYADVLSTKQERKLEELIERREEQIGVDIILVTIDEDLEDYVEEYEDVLGYVSRDDYEMVYADNFFDERNFGYDGPEGDGIILVDNFDSEQMWISTSGRLINFYMKNDDARLWHLIDLVCDAVVFSPYQAYKLYVNTVYYDQVGLVDFNAYVSPGSLALVVLILTVVLTVAKVSSAGTKDTTAAATYVKGGAPKMNRSDDVFEYKNVTQRRIESGGGGGGGGHRGGGSHRSAGGRSHGGGGGRH